MDRARARSAQQRGSVVDQVNQPEHYQTDAIECIQAIEAAMSPEEYAGYLRGNVMKYVWRYDKKHKANPVKAIEDLQKANWYLHRLTQFRLKNWGGGGTAQPTE